VKIFARIRLRHVLTLSNQRKRFFGSFDALGTSGTGGEPRGQTGNLGDRRDVPPEFINLLKSEKTFRLSPVFARGEARNAEKSAREDIKDARS